MTTYLEVGVRLFSAKLSIGTRTLVSDRKPDLIHYSIVIHRRRRRRRRHPNDHILGGRSQAFLRETVDRHQNIGFRSEARPNSLLDRNPPAPSSPKASPE